MHERPRVLGLVESEAIGQWALMVRTAEEEEGVELGNGRSEGHAPIVWLPSSYKSAHNERVLLRPLG